MKTAVLQVRLDGNLKKEADDLFASVGFDTTTAVRLFLKQSVIRRRIPFDIVGEDPVSNPSDMAVLRQSIQEAEEGKFVTKTLDELRAMEK
jgi:DNA-damage-inducible protein J